MIQGGVLTKAEAVECMERSFEQDPLFISPFSETQLQTEDSATDFTEDSAIDLRVGQYFLIQKPSQLAVLDVVELARNPLGKSMISEGYTTYRVPHGGHFTLHAGQTVRVATLEYLGMPADLHGYVTLRHSLAAVPLMADIP